MIDLKKVNKVRKEIGFTQVEIAHKIWISSVTYFRYENGKNEMNLSRLADIVKVFNNGRVIWNFTVKPLKKYNINDFLLG